MNNKITQSPYDKGLRPVILPFTGFYESIHSSFCDGEIELILEDDHRVTEDDIELDFQGYMKEYSEQYTQKFSDELFYHSDLMIYFTFNSLTSPRFYNFETDTIEAYIKVSDIYRLYKSINLEKFALYVKKRFTSRDGFISFYSSRLSEWQEKPVIEWDTNQVGVMLDFITQCYINDIYVENANEIASKYISVVGSEE